MVQVRVVCSQLLDRLNKEFLHQEAAEHTGLTLIKKNVKFIPYIMCNFFSDGVKLLLCKVRSSKKLHAMLDCWTQHFSFNPVTLPGITASEVSDEQ